MSIRRLQGRTSLLHQAQPNTIKHKQTWHKPDKQCNAPTCNLKKQAKICKISQLVCEILVHLTQIKKQNKESYKLVKAAF